MNGKSATWYVVSDPSGFRDQIQERLMHARILRQLRVERRCHYSSLPDGYGVVAFGGDDFNAGANALDLWRTDEDHFGWLAAKLALAD